MNRYLSKTLVLLLLNQLTHAALLIKPKAGIDLSMLVMNQSAPQNLPYLTVTGDVFLYYPYTNNNQEVLPEANRAYFNPANPPTQVSKDNTDATLFTQIIGGIEVSYYDEVPRPTDVIQLAPVLNLYVLSPDNYLHDIHNHAYEIQSHISGGIDVGFMATNNGNAIKIGGGARILRGEISTSSLFALLGKVKAIEGIDLNQDGMLEENEKTDNNANNQPGETIDLDLTQFNAEDKTPYKAIVDNIIMPYAYAEVSTEVGDILSAYVKTSYGFNSSPLFNEVPKNTAMFAGDSNLYASNSDWQIHTISAGLQIRVEQ